MNPYVLRRIKPFENVWLTSWVKLNLLRMFASQVESNWIFWECLSHKWNPQDAFFGNCVMSQVQESNLLKLSPQILIGKSNRLICKHLTSNTVDSRGLIGFVKISWTLWKSERVVVMIWMESLENQDWWSWFQSNLLSLRIRGHDLSWIQGIPSPFHIFTNLFNKPCILSYDTNPNTCEKLGDETIWTTTNICSTLGKYRVSHLM